MYGYARRLVSRVPSLLTRRVMPLLDRTMLWLTGGRRTLTSLFLGLPTVQLTTIGARSGQPRTVILVGIPDGQQVVLIASNWGQEHHPAWYHNLRANPRASLSVKGQPARPYVAREVTGQERERLWQKALALYPGYARYARRAAPRRIPVLALSPGQFVPQRPEFG